ncbi:MAG: cation:proton antiporter, partial [[Mycobacterium] stephanolepidis]
RMSRFSWRESIAIGAGLNTRGVIQIVIATVGVRCGVFGPEMFTALVVTTIVTTIIAAPVLRHTLAPNPDTEHDQTPAPADPQLELATSGAAIRIKVAPS